MFYSKLILITTLISIASNSIDAKEKLRGHYTEPRDLKKSKKEKDDKDSLKADFKSLDDDYDDLDGKVTIKEHKKHDSLVLEYDITDGAEDCDNCLLAIYNGNSCSNLGSSFDSDGRYDSDYDGEASGSFRLDYSYELKDLECKFIVIFDDGDKKKKNSKNDDDDDDEDDDKKKKSKKEDDDEDDDKKKKSRKDDDEDEDDSKGKKRRLAPRSPNPRRSLGKGKGASKRKKIGCGQLAPEGKSKNYCK